MSILQDGLPDIFKEKKEYIEMTSLLEFSFNGLCRMENNFRFCGPQ